LRKCGFDSGLKELAENFMNGSILNEYVVGAVSNLAIPCSLIYIERGSAGILENDMSIRNAHLEKTHVPTFLC
jgi:hypothetical protein